MMKKIRRIITIIKYLFPRVENKNTISGDDGILVLFPGKLGSAVLFCGLIDQLEKYGKTRDTNITILTSKQIAEFISLHFNYIYCDGSYTDAIENRIDLFNSIVKKFENKHYQYIINVYNGCLINSALMKAIPAEKYVTVLEIDDKSKSIKMKIKRFLFHKLHDGVIETNQQISCLDDFCNALSCLNNSNFKKELYRFPVEVIGAEKDRDNHDVGADSFENGYVVVSPGSSLAFKCWPYERYVEVIKIILGLESEGLGVCIIGDKNDIELSKRIVEKVEKTCPWSQAKRVIDLTGKTSYREWINTIGNSKLLIGNDSAAIHIAASVGVKYICIKGQWILSKFLPHGVISDSIKNSRVISCEKMDCSPCGSPGLNECIKNYDCMSKVKTGHACTCIENIGVNNVVDELFGLLNYENKN